MMSGSTPSPDQQIFDLSALEEALQADKQNVTTPLLKKFKQCLGELLCESVKSGNLTCTQKLIQAGAEPDFCELSFHGDTEVTFHVFAALRYFELNRQGFPVPSELDILTEYSRGCSRCDICKVKQTHMPLDELVFRHEYCRVRSPLVLAITNNNKSGAKFLIDKGVSLEKDCGNWHDTLHVNPVEIAILENNSDILLMCIDKGFDINQHIDADILGKCQIECFKILLKRGLFPSRFWRDDVWAIAAGCQGESVPDNYVEPQPASLKFWVRRLIRKQLLRGNPENLFVSATPARLPLPKSLCEYIVCDLRL